MKSGKTARGFSGAIWCPDIVANGNIFVEVTTSPLSGNLSNIFLKFADLQVKDNKRVCIVVVEKLYRRRKGFPRSVYTTFMKFGFPIIGFDSISKVLEFSKGKYSAEEISLAIPARADGHRHITESEKSRVLNLVSLSPRKRGDVSRSLGITFRRAELILKKMLKEGSVVRIHYHYGIDSSQISNYFKANPRRRRYDFPL